MLGVCFAGSARAREQRNAVKCLCFFARVWFLFVCFVGLFVCAPTTTNKSVKRATENTPTAQRKRSCSSEVFIFCLLPYGTSCSRILYFSVLCIGM